MIRRSGYRFADEDHAQTRLSYSVRPGLTTRAEREGP